MSRSTVIVSIIAAVAVAGIAEWYLLSPGAPAGADADNPEQVEQFRAGKDKVLGFFVGQIMQATQGKANPGQINQILRDKLSA